MTPAESHPIDGNKPEAYVILTPQERQEAVRRIMHQLPALATIGSPVVEISHPPVPQPSGEQSTHHAA